MFTRIAAATDFGPSSRRAVDLAVELANQNGAELVLVHVVEPFVPPYPIDPVTLPALPSAVDAAARRELEQEVERVRKSAPGAHAVLLRGVPAAELTRHAEEGRFDLVVVGTHGRKGPSRWLLGSVAEKVVRASHVPVLTVHTA